MSFCYDEAAKGDLAQARRRVSDCTSMLGIGYVTHNGKHYLICHDGIPAGQSHPASVDRVSPSSIGLSASSGVWSQTGTSIYRWDGEDDPHDFSHGGQNCFMGTMANPYVEVCSGTAGWFNDLYGFMAVDTTDVKASLCTCYQSLQWKASWPDPPAGGPDDLSGWTTEIAATIHECVEKDAQNQWQQRITRDDGVNQYHAIKSPYE